jgi:hypothetical protein
MPHALHPVSHHGPHIGPSHPVPASRLLDFVNVPHLDACLQHLVPDAGDRAFVLRCLVGEGPMHHRGANYVLLALLARVSEAHLPRREAGAPTSSVGGKGAQLHPHVAVPMRLPPHLSDQVQRGSYPLSLPTAALSALAGGDATQLQAMVDCLTDGPPQHALANVAMVALLEGLLDSQTSVASVGGPHQPQENGA